MAVLAVLAVVLGAGGITWATGPLRDVDTTRAVATTLEADERLSAEAIRVQAVDGTVYLTGIATTARQRERAEELASAVTGVRAVVNEIIVVPPAVEPAPSAFDEWARRGGW
jgi:hypothetical protein